MLLAVLNNWGFDVGSTRANWKCGLALLCLASFLLSFALALGCIQPKTGDCPVWLRRRLAT